MDHEQRPDTNSASFARVWNRVSAANGGSQIEVQGDGQAEPPSRQEEFIRQRIQAELVDYHTCARLAGSSFVGQLMRAIAGDELSQARRLSTAGFLLSGAWFFPVRETPSLPFQNWQDGMRTVFLRARQGAEEYRRAANQTSDPSLAELFSRLAEEESLHALRIRTALEHWG